MRYLALLAAAVVAVPLWAHAQNAYPTQELLSTGRTVVGEDIVYPNSGPAHVTASIVTIQPNAETVLHQHGVPMFAYILDGEVTVDYGDKGRRVFRAGEALMEGMAVTHRGMNLGSHPVRILAVYMGAAGSQNVILKR